MLRTPPSFNGREIDLYPQDPTAPHTHSAVRERRLPAGVCYAAVYPSLRSGVYQVEGSGQRVTVVGGRVTEIDFTAS
ncbi:MAG: hypothetical protein ABSG24_05270 [Acidimicrobiales bacterium]|jgi:hypothetical protein